VLFTVVTRVDGTFVSATQQPLPASNYPFGVVAADLNGDGNPDLVAVGYVPTPSGTSATPAMTMLLGNPDGSFTVGQTYPLPDAIADSVVIDDFNGDGKLDVVVPTGPLQARSLRVARCSSSREMETARLARPKRRV
jgi:uncharacterized protein (DUF2141 family)